MIGAELLLIDAVSAEPPQAARQQVKPAAVPKSSFQSALHKESQRQSRNKTPSSEPSQEAVAQPADDPILPQDREAGTGRKAETGQETGAGREIGDVAATVPPVLTMLPDSHLEAGLTAVLVGEQAEGFPPLEPPASDAVPVPSLLLSQAGTGPGTAGSDPQRQAAAAQQAGKQLAMMTEPALTAEDPVPVNGAGNSAFTAEILLAAQPKQDSVSLTGSSQDNPASPRADKLPPLAAMANSKAAEAQDYLEPQKQAARHEKQTVREWAEFENRKLTGQKTSMAQPSPAAEKDQAGREGRREYSFQAVRAEIPIAKFTGLSGPGMDKPAIPAAVNTQDVLSQIVRKAELFLKLNSSQMKIELQPEFLGKLTIKVMVEEGAVTARFITDNHQVKQMLEANLGILRQTLENQGIRVERAEVNVQLNNSGLFDGSEGQREWIWERHHTGRLPSSNQGEGNSYDADPRLLTAGYALDNTYGIQADGSLNFLI